jgi:hypothetical protein
LIPIDSTFKFSHVAPGAYMISASRVSENGSSPEMAAQQIAVNDSNLSGLALVLRPGINVTGHVTVEGNGAPNASGMIVFLSEEEGAVVFNNSNQSAAVQADGAFTVKGLGEGTYAFEVWSSCHTCYLKTATTKDGADLLSKGMQISSDSMPSSIELVYSSKTAHVSGTVTTKDDKPAPAAFVVLVPDAEMPNRDARFTTANTDQYGHFDMQGVPPGHYSAIALRDFDENSEPYRDPDFMRPLADKAQSLDVAEGDHTAMQLTVVSPADANP